MTLTAPTDPKLVRLRYVAHHMRAVRAFQDAASGLALALFENRDEISPQELAAKVAAGLRLSLGAECRAMGADLSPRQLDEIAASVELIALDMAALMHEAGSA
jgi:hypothetical protein